MRSRSRVPDAFLGQLRLALEREASGALEKQLQEARHTHRFLIHAGHARECGRLIKGSITKIIRKPTHALT